LILNLPSENAFYFLPIFLKAASAVTKGFLKAASGDMNRFWKKAAKVDSFPGLFKLLTAAFLSCGP
jgi:hypothetical protein